VVGSALPTGYSSDRRKLYWTDGSPTSSGSTTAGVEVPSAADKGFRITVQADGTPRTLTIYAGGAFGSGRFTATLSDGTTYVSPTVGNRWGSYDATLTLTFRAASAGKTVTVTWLADGSGTMQSWGRRGWKGATLRLQGAALR
jgi:hypothetical protein